MLISALQGLVDLLAPLQCPGCDFILTQRSSAGCMEVATKGEVSFVRDKARRRENTSVFEEEQHSIGRSWRERRRKSHAPGASFCSACEPLLERLPSGPSLYVFGGPLAEGIRKLKYQGRLDLLEPLRALLVSGERMHRGMTDMIVPIPLHPNRLRQRGFNQSELLFQPLAKALGAPCHPKALFRNRDTLPQVSVHRQARESNMQNAFHAATLVSKRRVLLVDDVRTTGATLRNASRALFRAGAESVRLMTLAGALAS